MRDCKARRRLETKTGVVALEHAREIDGEVGGEGEAAPVERLVEAQRRSSDGLGGDGEEAGGGERGQPREVLEGERVAEDPEVSLGGPGALGVVGHEGLEAQRGLVEALQEARQQHRGVGRQRGKRQRLALRSRGCGSSISSRRR